MLKDFQGGVRVDSKIKPLPYSERIQPVLTIGGSYFISFRNNNAYPCKLLQILNEFDRTEVKIAIPLKLKSKTRGFIDADGKRSFSPIQTCTYYAVEIGITPQEAVLNRVG